MALQLLEGVEPTSIRSIRSILQHLFQKAQLGAVKRRIPCGHVDLHGIAHDSLLMAEGVKAELTVIRTHTAIPNAAKRQVMIGEVHDCVVHATAAEREALNDTVGLGIVLGEHVACQGLLELFDDANHAFDVLVLDNRDQRAEDLFLHDLVIEIGMREYRRCDLAIGIVAFAANHVLFGLNQIKKPAVMALVDDLGVRIVGCGTRVAVRDLILHGSDQGIFHAAMSHDVIDGNACLTSVKQLSPYNSLGRDLDVGRLVA